MNKTITIGRNPESTICVSEQYDIVSNDHAEIMQQGVEIVFTDHSSNGTIINGQKIQGRSVNIYRGDKIVLAGVYELTWSQIDPLIVPVGRPTVARNIRGDINSPAGGQQRFSGQSQSENNTGRSRLTEQFRSPISAEPLNTPNTYSPTSTPYREPTGGLTSHSLSIQAERELSKWNWGAFYFGWLWGVFNKVYVALVQLVVSILSYALTIMGLGIIAPLFGLINIGISIWLGVKGSQMAWDNGAYRNLEHFRSSRHNWNVAAAICFGVCVFIILISLVLFIEVLSRFF